MTTAYSTLMGLALPVQGELSGTWGDTVNKGITDYVDIALAGTQTISGSQTAVTLSLTNGDASATNIAQAGSGATGTAQFAIINCTGNPASLLTVTVPASSRQYVVINATSTAQSVKIVGVGPTTGVTIVSGEKAHIAWDGSDFVKVASTVITNLTGVLPVANGGTGLSSGTSGGILAFTAAGTIASSSALAANAIVLGGGAGAAPATTTTGTGVVSAIGNAVNTSGGLVTQSGTLASSALLLGGGASTAISSTTTGTGVVTALGNSVDSASGLTTTTGTATLTNKRITPRIVTIADAATITPTGDTADEYTVTALAQAASVAAPSGTPTDGQKLVLRLKDNGVARALTWTTTSGAYRAVGTTLPTTTTAGKVTYVGCIYNSQDTFWDVVAVATQA